ncbi:MULTISPECIES: hypothetical protein [unclassified Vibrio]|uniref:hypothetical protein n=1 Tax=unclassified Vibrio TaxID=2614977 RepID=UPI001110E401|nr:hypothetical protein [Vibrio sp. Hep-1b-8]TMX33217.1 hypothetical protein DA100_16830 [Vibrio sp. Hep-1b-8]
MRAAISLRGLAIYVMFAATWFFFTTYKTNGTELTVDTKLVFLGEDSERFGGVSLYYQTVKGIKLRVRVNRESYLALMSSDITDKRLCSVVYFKNESFVFNEYQSVKSIQCDGRNLYPLSE